MVPMRNKYNLRTISAVAACICYILLGCIPEVFAQGFISRMDRPRWGARYENFSTYDLRRFPVSLIEERNLQRGSKFAAGSPQWVNPAWHGPADPVTFDQFGNFMLPGGDIYNLVWDKSSTGTYGQTVGQTDFYDSDMSGIFNNLMVSSDEFSNWQTKFMIGTNIRVFFTPSTLKRTNFNGVRWDASSRKNSFTFIASPGSKPGNIYDLPSTSNYRNLLGFYWESVLGDILKLGGTFVANQRGTEMYSNKDISMHTKGLNERDMERYLYIIITDDSPEDNSAGARVFGVKPIIDGAYRDLPQRVFYVQDFLKIHRYSNSFSDGVTFQSETDNPYSSLAMEKMTYSGSSWFIQALNSSGNNTDGKAFKQMFNKALSVEIGGYVNLVDPSDPSNPAGRMFAADMSKGFIEAYGSDIIIYEILLPPEARKVEFDVHVANDYCIDIVAALPSRQQAGTASWDDDPYSAAWNGNWSPIYDIKHCKKASGEVSDNSNEGWVRVVYDRMTGMAAYGLNMDFAWRGLRVKGEVNQYNSYWAYPVQELMTDESHRIESARAWFVNFEKDFGKWAVGGELFDYPEHYMQYWSPIDDNDDNDQYSDSSSGTGSPYEYPGLNADWDRAPGAQHVDTNWMGMPYIQYYFDAVSFGDDFNHNGIIDERENDRSADLPYDRDSSGNHFFLKIKPSVYSMMTLGHYDITQDVYDGENLTSYLKLEHVQNIGRYFQIGVFHRTERVQDNFKSDKYYYQFYWTDPDGRFNNLAFKDAWYNTSFLRTRIKPIQSVNIINNFKYDVINRVGDLAVDGTTVQQAYNAPKDIVVASHVHKIDYTFRLADFKLLPELFFRGNRIMKEKRIKEFKFMPQFKYESTYYTQDLNTRNNNGHYYNYYPVIRFDYRVAPNTLLRCALQGLPGFMEKRRDSGDQLHDIDRRRMFLGFETTTLYQGFNMLVTTGMRRDKMKWVTSYGRPETGETEYFISIRVEASK